MAKIPRPNQTAKPIITALNRCLYQQDKWRTYCDLLTQIETILQIPIHGQPVEKNTAKYTLAAAHAYLQQVHELDDWSDILGEVYMQYGSSNKHFGQFFTPSSVSKLMASITHINPMLKPKSEGLTSIVDPTCGAGVMLMKSIENIEETHGHEGLRQCMYVGIDLDITCCRMTAIQVAANIFVNDKQIGEFIVIHANTLIETITPKLIIHGTAPGVQPSSSEDIASMVPRKPVHSGILPIAVGFN